MSCFPCFSSSEKKAKRSASRKEHSPVVPHQDNLSTENKPQQRQQQQESFQPPQQQPQQQKSDDNHRRDISVESADSKFVGSGEIYAKSFSFRELATATKNFRPDCIIGEGAVGRVYKGSRANGQIVAIKQLDKHGLQEDKEFIVEALALCMLHHENLVNLIGYCADGEQRFLVYEFMTNGSLENHLLDIKPEQKPLDWYTRMKMATGAAKGLEYLHDKANPPVVYRVLKSSNILVDDDYNPKLSDFGLAKLSQSGEKMHVPSMVMGAYGYSAPECVRSGQLTVKSDVYSFGVVLLELITGRRAVDQTRPSEEENLVAWAQPIFKFPRRFPELADPLLDDDFPIGGLNQAVAVAAMCLQEEAAVRPLMSDVVTALSFLSIAPPEEATTHPQPNSPPTHEKKQSDDEKSDESEHEKKESDDDEKTDESEHEKKESDDDGDDDQSDESDESEHDEESAKGENESVFADTIERGSNSRGSSKRSDSTSSKRSNSSSSKRSDSSGSKSSESLSSKRSDSLSSKRSSHIGSSKRSSHYGSSKRSSHTGSSKRSSQYGSTKRSP